MTTKPSSDQNSTPRKATKLPFAPGALALGLLASGLVAFGISDAAMAQPEVERTVLINSTVIDGTGRDPIANASIVIEGNRIVEVGASNEAIAIDNARVHDLEGRFVLPGLWNNHSHLGDLLPDPKGFLKDEPILRAAIRAGRNAMDALKSGFTSLRMTGERDYIDVAWKEAFDSGVFVGPRIVPAGNPISSGDSGDWLVISADGPEAVRQAIDRHAEHGVELIKIIADRMSSDEIRAAIEGAHANNLPITAHSGGEKARFAVENGVDGIEHGNDVSDETIRLMAEKSVFLDPTIVCNLSIDYIKEREVKIREAGYRSDPEVIEGRTLVALADQRPQSHAELARTVLIRAFEAGVKIISGSDSNPIDEIGILEIEQLVFSGMTEMGALQAATRNSAEMVGKLDELGTIEAGKLADLIVLDKNPLEHISHLRSLVMVIKDGKFVNLSQDEGQASFWELYFLEP